MQYLAYLPLLQHATKAEKGLQMPYAAHPTVSAEACGMLLLAQVDNLRTNHRGTFVLKDLSFRWLAKLSTDPLPPMIAAQNGSPPMHPAAGTASVLSIKLGALKRPTPPCEVFRRRKRNFYIFNSPPGPPR